MSINTSLITGHTIITASIGLEASSGDIERVLGTSSGDLGTVCKSPYINKWAKYKPVSYANLINTYDQLKGGTGSDRYEWKTTATWWKGSNGHCGFEIVTSPSLWNASTADTSKSEVVREAEAASLDYWFNNGWKYKFGAQGGISSPFRQLDFNYYDHNAVPFIKSVTEPSKSTIYAGEDGGDMSWTMVLPSSSEATYSLSFADIGVFTGVTVANMHFGLIFVNTGSKFPDYSNFKFRKFVAINPLPLSNANGKSITLTGVQTAGLINDNNITSQQDYDVYPILTTGTLGASTSVVLFGSTDFGSVVVVPNSNVFQLSIVPNELEGFIEGQLDYFESSGSNRIYYGTYLSIVNRSTKAATISSANNISLQMQIWGQGASSYSLIRTLSSGYSFSGTTFPVTVQAGASINLPVSWAIAESNFTQGQEYFLRETGTITYRKTGASSDSTATLLSYPTYDPNNIKENMVFQSHITIDNVTSSSFRVNIWAVNTSDVSNDFSWDSVLYDIVSYSKTSSGTNYSDGLEQPSNTISGTSESGIASGGSTSVKRITITPRYSNYGYFASVTVHANTGRSNVGSSTATADYPTT